MRRVLAAVLGVAALVVGLVILGVIGDGVAVATPPLRAGDQITDQADALGGDDAQVRQAIDRLRADDGTQLFIVFVSSFDGLDGQNWADQSAQQSQLGSSDVLFAVAVDDRVYGLSVDQDYPLADEELSDLLVNDVEPQLSEQDWAGAAIALADGLGGAGSGSGGIPIALLLGGAVLAGGGYLVYRRRKQAGTKSEDSGRAPDQPRRSGTGEAHADPHADLTTQQLTFQASSALIDLDDAVQTSAQELTFAQGQFGDEAVTGFQEALDASRAELGQAFALRQQLDDEVPEAEPAQRRLLGEILRLCQSADQRLDSQSEAFDRLRDLDHTAPQVLAGLTPKVDGVEARLPKEEQRLNALRGRYAATALSAIADDVEQARALLDNARKELDEARAALKSPTPSAAVVSLRTAEDATAQADQLLDGIWRLETELAEAGAALIAARLETDKDLAEARTLLSSGDSGGLASMVARAETALAAADAAVTATAGDLPDPLTALRQLTEADLALDGALGSAREVRTQADQIERRLDQAMLTAQSSLAAAEDFITTRRGVVGSQARTRLAEGQRHLDQAVSLTATDPAGALREAQHADALGQQALHYARSDVDHGVSNTGVGRGGYGNRGGSRGRGYGGGGGPDLGSLVLGGILFGGGRGGGGFGGGFGGGGFGGGGGGRRSTGSFGGSGSRGRRGGGGRF